MLIALWIPGANQGWWRVDTGLYAAIALHAWREGPLFPLMAGDQPYFNKPPLAFWVHGLFLHALGKELWVARLPALMAAIGATLILMRCVRLLSGDRAAFAAGIILASTVEFFRASRSFSLDLWLTMWVIASVWPVAEVVRGRAPGRVAALAGLPIGGALLTKPIVGLFMLTLLACWLVWIGRARLTPWLGVGAILALGVAAPWHLAMNAAFPDEFVGAYFGRQSLDRAAGSAFGTDPWWTYLTLMSRTWWPWLPVVIVGALGAARKGDAGARLALVSFCGWLCAISLFAAKEPRYAIVVYPFGAWLAGWWLGGHAPRAVIRARRALDCWGPPVALAGAAALSGVRVHAPPSEHWRTLGEFLRSHPGARLWADPTGVMRWTTSNIYLMTGQWPRTAAIDSDSELLRPIAPTLGLGARGSPDVGDLFITRTDAPLGPRATDEPLWSSGPLRVSRVRTPWDGQVVPQAGSVAHSMLDSTSDR